MISNGMNKISKRKITYMIFALAALILFALGFILPQKASAQSYGYDTGFRSRTKLIYDNTPVNNPVPFVESISPISANAGEGARNVTITGGRFVPSSVGRVDGSDRPTTFIDQSHLIIQLYSGDMAGANGRYVTVFNPAPKGGYSNAVFFTINGYVEPAPGTVPQNFPLEASVINSGENFPNDGKPDEKYGNLAANAVFGTTSFMPSGLVQWVLFAILVLLAVIIIRRIFGADKKYHSAPLKHA